MHQHLLLALTGVVLFGALAQWLSWKLRIPAILFLLLAGLVAGPFTGLLQPDAMFGELLFPIVSLAVAVILFEGSLTLRFEEVRGLSVMIRRLVSVGMLASWAVASVAARVFVGLDWSLAALFGALVVVTGPTVIVPLLRAVRPKAGIATVLRWEGIVIDSVGAVLAVLVYQFVITRAVSGDARWDMVGLTFLSVIGVGVVLGALGGYLLGIVLRRHWLPDFLINMAVLAAVLTVFSVSNVLAHESGLLAVTVMGILLANMKHVPLEGILDFKETLTLLFVSALFILLAARIDLQALRQVGLGSLLVLAAIQVIGQPLKVWLSGIGTQFGWREKLMLAWIGPRGIVAAAISGLFALRLQEAGFVGADRLVPLTFIVILGTVIFASATARPLARWLGVAEPEDRGVLIVGANRLSRAIATALNTQGFRTLLVDSDYTGIRAARMEGLNAYFGNPVSAEADRKLDLVGIGRLFALSRHSELNALATVRYRREFGAGNVYVLRTRRETEGAERERIASHIQGRPMFGENVSHADLLERLEAGAKISATRLTATFDWEAYQQRFADGGQLLFAVSPAGRLYVTGPAFDARPAADWVLIGLYQPQPEGEAVGEDQAVTAGA